MAARPRRQVTPRAVPARRSPRKAALARCDVELRDTTVEDLPIFFEHQSDASASHMAAFTSKDPADREAFMAKWAKILADSTITKQTILHRGQVVGHVASYLREGKPEVFYWIGSEHWGQGIATAALRAFIDRMKARPLHASVALDNVASRRVLEKCGFTVCGQARGFSNARGKEIDELFLVLAQGRPKGDSPRDTRRSPKRRKRLGR